MEYKQTQTNEENITASISEPETLRLAKKGDAAAIAAIYDTYNQKIFRYLRSQVFDHQLAEHFAGEVFIRMLNALPNYQPTSVPFQSWLFRIARNLIIDYHRTEKKRLPVSLDAVRQKSASKGDPARALDRTLTAEQLTTALLELPEGQRGVLVLRFLVGLPIKEVSEITEKTEAAVKALQHRGLAALRFAFSKEDQEV